MIRVSRRRFITLAGGLVVTGCTGRSASPAAVDPTPPTASPATSTTTAPPTSAAPAETVVTTIATDREVVPGDRVLVMVELAGGNDALNTMPPLEGPYQGLRPTLALADDELVTAAGLDGYALHAALGPLVPLIDEGRVAMIAGIGFDDPDRSHFVSTDRWLRADRMDDTLGWLGRWLDTLPTDLPGLGATALGNNGGLILGAERRGTVVSAPDAFTTPEALDETALRALTDGSGGTTDDDPLVAAAQDALAMSLDAVDEFGDVTGSAATGTAGLADGFDAGDRGFRTGLSVAADLITSEVGTRVVTVTVGGFDTHSDQRDTHTALLADLAAGLVEFWERIDTAGMSDRVMVATHSEFGRRVADNGSGGCDHGAAGLSVLMGDPVVGGVHGAFTTDDLLDGDLRPVIDPRTMFTACLDWLGADVEAILGDRYDEVVLLA